MSVQVAADAVSVESGDGRRWVGQGYDIEEALLDLRSRLEDEGLRLLCNRFRRDAFVSSMARQMSGGRGCYLVRMGQSVDPEMIVGSLDPAPLQAVATAEENAEFVQSWIQSCQ